MCERKAFKGSSRFELSSSCPAVSILFCKFLRCSTNGNGGSVYISKKISVHVYRVEVVQSTSQGYGGGFFIQTESGVVDRLCFSECAAYGDYPFQDNNHFHGACFRGFDGPDPIYISNTACYLCPSQLIDGDVALATHQHSLNIRDINITNCYLRTQMLDINDKPVLGNNQRINLASSGSAQIIYNSITGTPALEYVNIVDNYMTIIEGDLIANIRPLSLKTAVIAFNKHKTFAYSSQIQLDNCFFCMNSFPFREISSCPPTLHLKNVPPLECAGTDFYTHMFPFLHCHILSYHVIIE